MYERKVEMLLFFSTRKKYWNSIFRHQLGQNVLAEDSPGEKILTAFVFKVKDFVLDGNGRRNKYK